MKRRKRQGQKHPSAAETTPEALQETWSLVAEELRATGFQVSVEIPMWLGVVH